MDELIDWIIERNKSGYQMVNSVRRLQEIKAFMRMSSGADLRRVGWYGEGNDDDDGAAEWLASMPGIVRDDEGEVHFTDCNCRAAVKTM